MDGVVDVIPAQAKDFLAAEAESEREVDGSVPGICPLRGGEYLSAELGIDHGETRSFPDRSIDQLRGGGVPSHESPRLGARESLREHPENVGDRLGTEAGFDPKRHSR
jgi:hypothetical protein